MVVATYNVSKSRMSTDAVLQVVLKIFISC